MIKEIHPHFARLCVYMTHAAERLVRTAATDLHETLHQTQLCVCHWLMRRKAAGKLQINILSPTVCSTITASLTGWLVVALLLCLQLAFHPPHLFRSVCRYGDRSHGVSMVHQIKSTWDCELVCESVCLLLSAKMNPSESCGVESVTSDIRILLTLKALCFCRTCWTNVSKCRRRHPKMLLHIYAEML